MKPARLLGAAGRLVLASALLSHAAPAFGADEAAAIAGPREAAPSALAEGDEMILELRTRDFVLSEGLLAYHLAGRSYLPLGELSRALEFAIAVEAGAGRASGWYLSEDRAFELDVARRSVTVGGRTSAISDQDVRVHAGEIYVEADLLTRWLPLGLQIDRPSLEARLTTREPFPFEARAERERLRAHLGDGSGELAEWERENTPFELFTPPAIDLAIGANYGDDHTSRLEHQTRASGDLLYMNASLFVRGDSSDPIADARFLLERKDWDGDLPLGMTHIAVGDTYSAGLPLGLRSDSGRGAFLTNASLGQASAFSRTDIQGEVAQGYDVELFRNGVLIATQRETNGRYLFVDVPLVFGRNELRLVFSGPRGERREEIEVVQIGDGRLTAGENRFAASVIQPRRALIENEPEGGFADSRWIGSAYGEYGLADALTLAGGSALVVEKDRSRGLLLGGVRTGVSGAALAADAAMWTDGGAALQIGIAGESLGVSYALTHAEYAGGFVDETRSAPGTHYSRSTELRLDGLVNYSLGGGPGPEGVVATSLVAAVDVHADGRLRTNAVLRTGANLGGWAVANSLDYVRDEGGGADAARSSLRGSVDASTIYQGSAIRARLDYSPGGEHPVTAAGFQVDRAIGADMRARIDLAHDFTGGGASAGFAVSREFASFDLSLSGRYGHRDGLELGLRFTTSLGWSPARRSWFQTRPGLAKGGAVEALVFRDRNGDGLRQAGEELVADAAIASSGRSAVTDAAGVARLGGLSEGRPVLVRVSPGASADPFAAPARSAFEVSPRPGRIHAVEIGIITAGEIEGVVRLADAAGGRAMAGLTVQLLDEAGEPAGAARTEYDGFYVIQGVRPGRYSLRLDPEEGRRYGLAATSPISVTVQSAGGVLSGMDFIIG